METKINEEKIHDFSRKLRQKSAINSFKEYIKWQRDYRSGEVDFDDDASFPIFGPVSINLDLTTACNFRCAHCVDSRILNTGDKFTIHQVAQTVDTLCSHGLKSVLLIGGGEPTLHPKFNDIVRYLKGKKLQVGIVTNGSMMDKIIEVSDCLGGVGDWIRLSLDAGTDRSFQGIHCPRGKSSLQEICDKVKELKRIRKSLVVGCSYIIIWEGCELNGVKLLDNIQEIPDAVNLAIDSGFDYISFKPCLLKLYPSNTESLLYCETEEFKNHVVWQIKDKLEKANEIANGKTQLVTSLNLQAIFNDTLQIFKRQPRNCHMQLFRQVVTPIGIFHCPAYRGYKRAQIGNANDYVDEGIFLKTVVENYKNMLAFNASEQCKDIICFYNRVNNWIEEFLNSGKNVEDIEECEDVNFFI